MSSPVPALPCSSPDPPNDAPTTRIVASSPDYFAEVGDEHFTYESLPSLRVSPTLRPRAATVSSSMMSAVAARATDAMELFEHTAITMQESVVNGTPGERSMVTTPTPVFPSIGPGLVLPPSPPAPALLVRATASAVIATPQPRRAPPEAARLTNAVSLSLTDSSNRQERKRPRLDSPSPSPAPVTGQNRAPPGAIRRSSQTVRSRIAPLTRPYALAPATWRSPASSHGRLAPVAIEAIANALLPLPLPAAGPSRLPQPSPSRGVEAPVPGHSRRAGSRRMSTIPEPQTCEEGVFDLDMDTGSVDLPLALTPDREIPPFGHFRRPLLSGDARSPADFEQGLTRTPPRPDPGQTAMDFPEPLPGATELSDDRWDALLAQHLDDAPVTTRAPPETTAATPSRPQAQSAADLAASFTAPPNPIQIPTMVGQGVTTNQNANFGPHPANPGMGGGITFTPVPPGGFPEVIFPEPDGVFLGLPRERVNALTGDGPDEISAVALQVHNSGFPPPHEVHAITAAITATIRRITGELNPLVVPPEREWSAINDRRAVAPVTWAVVGISPDSVRRILARSTWSSTTITIHVHEPAIRIGRFMLVVGGFAHDHNGSILNAVFTVFVGPVVLPALFALVQTNPRFANVAPEAAVRAILASLEVRVSTLQNGNLLAAVFCDSPTESIARWREWRDALAALPFPSPLNSTGFARRIAPCAGCHGYDHPTHLCPFQDVQGWNAPPPGSAWRQPGLAQGTAGQQQPPPPPPPGGAMTRNRSQTMRRNNSSSNQGPKHDHSNGGPGGYGMGGGAKGFGPGGAGAGAGTGTFA
ncbi:hypothetical protein TRAPUB_3214 [Trametes pubescens]|uniref:Uncharacterized protein n=1 Tax=Trametes pubescens TaxID=154538 RepID=A0A1M2VEC1_TRAPU|nr:hypothetical protein TRAPUB_3214 [Trametes pubescens]